MVLELRVIAEGFRSHISSFYQAVERGFGDVLVRRDPDFCWIFVRERKDSMLASCEALKTAIGQFNSELNIFETDLEWRSDRNIGDEPVRLAHYTGLADALDEFQNLRDEWLVAILFLSKTIPSGGCIPDVWKWVVGLRITWENVPAAIGPLTVADKWRWFHSFDPETLDFLVLPDEQ